MKLGDAEFFAHVAAHAGDIAIAEARRVTQIVASALAAHLPDAGRRLVADELPPGLAGTVLRAAAGVALPIEAHVRGPGIGAGRARELVACVCRVLAEELSDEALACLLRGAPGSIAALLVRPDPAYRAPTTHGTTLADGRPGSGNPISGRD